MKKGIILIRSIVQKLSLEIPHIIAISIQDATLLCPEWTSIGIALPKAARVLSREHSFFCICISYFYSSPRELFRNEIS
jgi:hypothetical protein